LTKKTVAPPSRGRGLCPGVDSVKKDYTFARDSLRLAVENYFSQPGQWLWFIQKVTSDGLLSPPFLKGDLGGFSQADKIPPAPFRKGGEYISITSRFI
jgi:hypothetical protein